MSGLTLQFLGWDRPVLAGAIEVLKDRWQGSAWDLSDTILLVPTAETGRRLREALAVEAARLNGAVMAPHVWSPETALMAGVERQGLASHLEEQLAWTRVLESIELEAFSQLFPTLPVIERHAWASGVAETLAHLRHATGAGGLSFAEVAKALAQGEDAARWGELAQLEIRYLQALEQLGVRDGLTVRAAVAKNPQLPPGVRQILVLALADPPLMLRNWLKAASGQTVVKVLVQAPLTERERFDEWGMPRASAWVDRAPWLALREEQLHVENLAEQQAHRMVNLVRQLAGSGSSVAVGVADPSLSSHLAGALAGEGVEVYDPSGRQAGQHALLDLLRTWQELLQGGTWRKWMVFLRQDDVLRVLAEEAGLPQETLLAVLDDFYKQRLPGTVAAAYELSGLPLKEDRKGETGRVQTLLADVLQRIESWQNKGVVSGLRSLLEWIYGSREFKTEDEQDRDYTLLLGEVMRLAVESEVAAERLGMKNSALQLLPTVLRELEQIGLADLRGEVGMVLRGWLELLWEPAPGLVIGGFNDEAVPGVVAVDAFLPDHVRERLGLACQRSRWARDAYLFTALAGQRQETGQLHLVLGQLSDAGDVLRPSRLLFACDDATLPDRVRQLFPQEAEKKSAQEPPHVMAWRLRPQEVKGWKGTVSPSLLKSYLRCPARCYLERILRMTPVDAAQREMTVMDFGELVHDVLREFGRNIGVRDSFAEQQIANFFDETLKAMALKRWGRRPLLSTALQIESARQRLAHAAREQAALRAQGWRIHDVEMDLNADGALTLAGLKFSARVDRVDVGRDGAVRVLDYKTSHKPRKPQEAHMGPAKKEHLEDEDLAWKCFAGPRGGVKQWTDLQLPLYVWALKSVHVDAPRLEAGYFHLPAAVTETRVDIWDMDEDLLERAHACAEEAATRLKQGVFWPPAQDLRRDDFDELLLGDALTSLHGDAFIAREGTPP